MATLFWDLKATPVARPLQQGPILPKHPPNGDQVLKFLRPMEDILFKPLYHGSPSLDVRDVPDQLHTLSPDLYEATNCLLEINYFEEVIHLKWRDSYRCAVAQLCLYSLREKRRRHTLKLKQKQKQKPLSQGMKPLQNPALPASWSSTSNFRV